RALAVEDRADAALHVLVADVGHEADAALIDADDGNVMAHEVARGGEHGAVAADDHGEIGALAERRVIEAAGAALRRSVLLEQNFTAALAQIVGQRAQRSRDLGTAQLADQRDAPEARPAFPLRSAGSHAPSVQ